jgi:hypothetical protein
MLDDREPARARHPLLPPTVFCPLRYDRPRWPCYGLNAGGGGVSRVVCQGGSLHVVPRHPSSIHRCPIRRMRPAHAGRVRRQFAERHRNGGHITVRLCVRLSVAHGGECPASRNTGNRDHCWSDDATFDSDAPRSRPSDDDRAHAGHAPDDAVRRDHRPDCPRNDRRDNCRNADK